MPQAPATPASLTEVVGHPITEDDIADYLLNTPEFFERHADLLLQVQLCSPHSARAVSLQERQASMLREKIRLLESRIMDMIRNANDNTVLSDKLLTCGQLFLDARVAPDALPSLVEREVALRFGVPLVGVRLWDVAPQWAQAPFVQGVGADARVFVSSLPEPFCGVNTGLDAVAWLAPPSAAASVAILPLRPAQAQASPFGMLVLASPDAQRYTSDMGTDFLARLARLVAAVLGRLRD